MRKPVTWLHPWRGAAVQRRSRSIAGHSVVAQFEVRKDISVSDIPRAQHTYHPLPLVSWIIKRERDKRSEKERGNFSLANWYFQSLCISVKLDISVRKCFLTTIQWFGWNLSVVWRQLLLYNNRDFKRDTIRIQQTVTDPCTQHCCEPK